MKSTSLYRTWIYPVAIVQLMVFSASVSAQDPEIEAIRRAWQERQDRFATFEVEWQELRTTMKGTLRDKRGKPFPPQDTTHAITHTMFGDDTCFYHSYEGMLFDMELGKFVETKRIYSFDGEQATRLSLCPARGPYPPAAVSRRLSYGGGTNYHILAPIVTFRPLNVALSGIALEQCQLREEPVMLDGISCRLLVYRKDHSRRMYWLAEDDRRIVRQELSFGGRISSQITIDYEPREESGMVASGWEHIKSHHVTGDVQGTFASRLTHTEFNHPLAARRFEVQLPPRTIVTGPHDEIAIIREDGSQRPVTNSEVASARSVEDLLASDPPPEAYREEPWDVRVLIIGVLSLVLGGAIWARYRGWA